jgi:hypothetical protein
MAVDLLRDGEVIASVEFPEVTLATYGPDEIYRGVQPVSVFRPEALDPTEVHRWTLRLKGDAEASLREFDCGRYWSGERDYPLAEVLTR